jgi:amidophosphoribosyltransferase
MSAASTHPTPKATFSGAAVPRGDGLLSHDLDPQQPGPQDACGVFGVWAPGEEVAKLTYFGLYALQHRGQEAAGIAVSDGSSVVVYKDLGLVAQVFDEPTLASLRGHIAIGHARYSTTGASNWENAQPTLRATQPRGAPGTDREAATTIALAHNGNLVNTADLARRVAELGIRDATTTSDTALVTALLVARPDLSVEAAALEVLPTLRGAFSFVFMDEDTLYAARDPQGVRPLVLGRLERGWVVASETAALDMVGASVVREIEPGELLAIDEHGLRSSRFANPEPKGCLFEYVYLARPDTTISGRNVYAARVGIGRALAREHPAEADLVIPVPESGTPAAIGYAEESGIPYGMGLVKNAYVGRTFIQPSQTIRQLGIRLKLNPLRDVVRGKRIVVVDDSIVRGNTQRAIIRMLREAGAVEVHVRISSPPVKWPCFYGIDFATKAELLANGLDNDGIRRSIGADSLGYISLPGLIAATEQPKTRLCRACFDGEYPIDLPADNVIGKHVLEGLAKTATNAGGHAQRRGPDPSDEGEQGRRAGTGEPAGGDRLAASPGGADALSRP